MSIPDPGVILAYNSNLLAEIEGLLLLSIQPFPHVARMAGLGLLQLYTCRYY